MAKKSADWQNRRVSPLNCLGNDVKLYLAKPAWFAGKFPVNTLSLNSGFTKEHFGWLVTGSAPITGGSMRLRENGVIRTRNTRIPEDLAPVGFGEFSLAKTRF